ncbi:MAG: hypothetical protein A2174_02270 [Candidatus Portnoybacteria bacterium RBG_13_41_18]|uniref:Glycosyl transferase family 1 domain-containing protein n=1 Tax=Candidatus Portnoybacteria bacterium RBG_13_41_18 TaxID=1801991 RepID=A0A1G2FB14_9BACT|nr:MAG: hypothetical protein A2174_02270 [Candidatus Portnoybacteria bacterium RBG_13_41_18]
MSNKLKIAFIIGDFPAVSETFIIDQVADLKDRGVDVEIFAFRKHSQEGVSERYYDYKMSKLTNYLEMPANKLIRIVLALRKLFKILLLNHRAFFRVLNFKKYGANARSLKLIFWVEPFLGKKFDLVHCHFGPAANKFLIIKEILGLKTKIVTSFYGFDVSKVFQDEPVDYYYRLKKECLLFFVMSENMKERVVARGFNSQKVIVHPVGIDVEKYNFSERRLAYDESVNIVTVGRFVEKKGFDDLLKALKIVKEKTAKKFMCHIIGGGPLEKDLQKLTDELKLRDVVEYKGYMKIEDVINYFSKMHFFVQPSKTARDGDME